MGKASKYDRIYSGYFQQVISEHASRKQAGFSLYSGHHGHRNKYLGTMNPGACIVGQEDTVGGIYFATLEPSLGAINRKRKFRTHAVGPEPSNLENSIED